MLAPFSNAFHGFIQEPNDYDGAELLAAWGQQVPDSSLRHLAAVALKRREAWRALGPSFASEVTPEGMVAFKMLLAQADELLDARTARWSTSPLWYQYKIDTAIDRGDEATANAVFLDAVRAFPTYLPVYFARLRGLTPKWGGSYEQLDVFIRSSVKALRASEGESAYARLYMRVAQERLDSESLFRDSRVSWPVMKNAFQDLLQRFPDHFNRQLYAGYACAARDRETTAKLLSALGPHGTVLGSEVNVSTDNCRRFALTPS